MKNIRKFNNLRDFQDVYDHPASGYVEPWVSLTYGRFVKRFIAHCPNGQLDFAGDYVGESNAYGGTFKWVNPSNGHEYYTRRRNPAVGDYVVFGDDWDSWETYVETYGDTITSIEEYVDGVDYNVVLAN